MILVFPNLSLSKEVENHFTPIPSWAMRPSYGEGAARELYEGPLWPKIRTDRKLGAIVLTEESFEVVTQSTLYEIERLKTFWFEELPERETCPDEVLNTQAEFLQYLFRLISLSYAYETVKDIHIYLAKLESAEKCQINSNELWGRCKSHDPEMEKFVRRALNDKQSDMIEKLSFSRQKKVIADWWKNEMSYFRGKGDSQPSSIASGLLQSLIKPGVIAKVNQSWVKQQLSEQCQKIKHDIRMICNEKDFLYGVSSVKEARLLIERSHAFAQINKTGHGVGCMRRFVELFQRLEKPVPYFPDIFPAVMSALVREDAPYLQGKLFLLGSLQEFEEKGLTGLLYEEKRIPTPTPIPIKKKAVVSVLPTPVPTPVPVVVATPTPTPIPMPKLAQFELAVRERLQFNSDKVPVNMKLMRSDYPFSDKMIVALSEPLKKFQTRKAIRDMKELDHLGSRDEPVHLLFLKFLIDNDYHQGLFNLQAEIGAKFWVINDFEKGVVPQWIELVNDQSTQSHWQIYIVRPPADFSK